MSQKKGGRAVYIGFADLSFVGANFTDSGKRKSTVGYNEERMKDIDLIMSQTGASIDKVSELYDKCERDIVNTIMAITDERASEIQLLFPQFPLTKIDDLLFSHGYKKEKVIEILNEEVEATQQK
jgi:hypothetical protein